MDNTDTLATKQTNKQKLKIPLIKTHKKQDEQHGPHQKQGLREHLRSQVLAKLKQCLPLIRYILNRGKIVTYYMHATQRGEVSEIYSA